MTAGIPARPCRAGFSPRKHKTGQSCLDLGSLEKI